MSEYEDTKAKIESMEQERYDMGMNMPAFNTRLLEIAVLYLARMVDEMEKTGNDALRERLRSGD